MENSIPGGDQRRGDAFLTVSLFTYALVLLSGGLRLITRGFIVHQMGWDDYTVAMALVRDPMIDRSKLLTNIKSGLKHHIYGLQCQRDPGKRRKAYLLSYLTSGN